MWICVVRVEICDCDRVLAGTTSFHSVDFPWHRSRSVFLARGPKTLCRATFAMPHPEQRLRTDSKRISSNLLIHELFIILLVFVSAAEPRRGAPSKYRLIDWLIDWLIDIIIDKLLSSVSKVTSPSWEIVTNLRWECNFLSSSEICCLFIFSFDHARMNLNTTRPFVRLYSSIRSSASECKNYKVFIYKFTFCETIVIARERHHRCGESFLKEINYSWTLENLCWHIWQDLRV